MANKTFDKDTMLDLVVNMVPLAIILFFVVAFAVVNPFGVESLASGLQFALLIVPFVALAILTYLSGKAIAGAEKTSTVYPPGAATVPGMKPLHEEESELEESPAEDTAAVEGETT